MNGHHPQATRPDTLFPFTTLFRSGRMSGSPTSGERRRAMLRTAMGQAMAAALADPRVIEVMVTPDGALRVDILGEGRVDTDVRIDCAQVERIIDRKSDV